MDIKFFNPFEEVRYIYFFKVLDGYFLLHSSCLLHNPKFKIYKKDTGSFRLPSRVMFLLPCQCCNFKDLVS